MRKLKLRAILTPKTIAAAAAVVVGALAFVELATMTDTRARPVRKDTQEASSPNTRRAGRTKTPRVAVAAPRPATPDRNAGGNVHAPPVSLRPITVAEPGPDTDRALARSNRSLQEALTLLEPLDAAQRQGVLAVLYDAQENYAAQVTRLEEQAGERRSARLERAIAEDRQRARDDAYEQIFGVRPEASSERKAILLADSQSPTPFTADDDLTWELADPGPVAQQAIRRLEEFLPPERVDALGEGRLSLFLSEASSAPPLRAD